ncbi:MAG: hypothetical protein M1826_006987 [Phylliscum demangeonii]|nr:MAG: hypothetical protein M1826_006987 [Phylliscum demangeonii]
MFSPRAEQAERLARKTYDANIVMLAALLHDVGDPKYLSPGQDGTRQAADFLTSANAPRDLADTVQEIVNAVSFSGEAKNPAAVAEVLARHPELGPVQDADRLDALGAVGVARRLQKRTLIFPISRHVGEPAGEWVVPHEIESDAVWMECIYDYTRTGVRVIIVHAWDLAAAIVDCAKHHDRHVDALWLTDLHRDGGLKMTRPHGRMTGSGEKEGNGHQVREAAPQGHGLLLGPTRPGGTSARHMFAGVAASARHAPTHGEHGLAKEAPWLKREAASAY